MRRREKRRAHLLVAQQLRARVGGARLVEARVAVLAEGLRGDVADLEVEEERRPAELRAAEEAVLLRARVLDARDEACVVRHAFCSRRSRTPRGPAVATRARTGTGAAGTPSIEP